jgi:hypothetical protein
MGKVTNSLIQKWDQEPTACSEITGTFTNSLIQNNGNSNQQHDPKSPEQ